VIIKNIFALHGGGGASLFSFLKYLMKISIWCWHCDSVWNSVKRSSEFCSSNSIIAAEVFWLKWKETNEKTFHNQNCNYVLKFWLFLQLCFGILDLWSESKGVHDFVKNCICIFDLLLPLTTSSHWMIHAVLVKNKPWIGSLILSYSRQ